MKRTLVSTVAVFLSAAAPALAESADRLVKETCANCHAVGADTAAQSPDAKAPRFIDVAKMPSTTELSIKVFLRSSHRNMPNFILSPEEIDATAAYILGLRKN
jgi:mono/diheme cytochrome c family protein